MMHLKTNKLKYTIKTSLFLILSIGFTTVCAAQDANGKTKEATTTTEQDTISKTQHAQITSITYSDSKKADTSHTTSEKFLIDGVAAVVGKQLILFSDIQKMYKDLKSQGISTEGITNCELAVRLLKNKLYAHRAVQDSIPFDEQQIRSRTKQQIDYFVDQTGSMDKVLEFYNISSEAELRSKLFQINKETQLAKKMQDKIIKDIEITPQEVRTYFEAIPEDERPKFGDEVEIAQIVIKPITPQEEINKTIARLKEFRKEILSGESTFATKAVLYSEDPGTNTKGGQITLNRNSRFVREFMQAAFSLQIGEISQPFKSKYGYHILQVDAIRGQERDVRHILLVPEITQEAIENAKSKIDSIRNLIVNDSMSFFDAARRFSDQEETRGDGGQLINPVTGTTRFDQTKVDPSIYNVVIDLKEDEVSHIISDFDRTRNIFFKIITVTERYPAHVANFTKDYAKIKRLALKSKQLKEVGKWQKEAIKNTYIKINGKLRDCGFEENWLKK